MTTVRPFNAHTHLREGWMLPRIAVPETRVFSGSIIMPNLKKPVTTCGMANVYRDEILKITGPGYDARMTLYLTGNTTPVMIYRAAETEYISGIKFYPKGATTNSADGVSDIFAMGEVLKAMERTHLPLLIHGEMPDGPLETREQRFIEQILVRLIDQYPDLRIVFEHISSLEGAKFMQKHGKIGNIVATATPHHLCNCSNARYHGNDAIRNSYHCFPVIKSVEHQRALLNILIEGSISGWLMLGTDSAPHPLADKLGNNPKGGCYSTPIAMKMYYTAFMDAQRINPPSQDKTLEDAWVNFAYNNARHFYNLPHIPDLYAKKEYDPSEIIEIDWPEGIATLVYPIRIFNGEFVLRTNT